uniref:Lipoxygenase 1 n=1 Tax=Aegilops tauschii TaxID=37682 RepID=M8BE92_AEGTA
MKVLVDSIKSFGLNIDDIRGQGYDNGSHTEGKYKRVQCGKLQLPSMSIESALTQIEGSDGRGMRGEAAALDAVIASGETELDVELPWDDEALGAPGAVLVTNHSDLPVYLKLLSLTSPAVHFVCDGWVYPVGKHPYRLFFTNDAYVKENTPAALLKDREDELRQLRGEGVPADEPLQKWDRVYDYALYNDLGNPDLRKDLARPVLGGSEEYPYPRRTRTSRPPTKTDPESEARVPVEQEVYIPCDERVGPAVSAPSLPKLGGHFKSLADIYSLFGLGRPTLLYVAIQIVATLFRILDSNRYTIKELIDGTVKPVLSLPQVISANPKKWRTDEEFAREMLAGTSPVAIKRVTEFPLTSKLERAVYGDQNSRITKEHVEKNMGGSMAVPQHQGLIEVVPRILEDFNRSTVSYPTLPIENGGLYVALKVEQQC